VDLVDQLLRQVARIYAAGPTEISFDDEEVAVVMEDTLSRVHAELGADCERCELCFGRTKVVFGVGNPDAELMIIGEAPGENEDKRGEPFVGRAGEMLNKQLQTVLQLTRGDVYITNVVKCRPPDNRDPTAGEVDACLPFLHRQIDVVNPKAILLLGSVASRALLGDGIRRLRGQWLELRDRPVIATYHPAYLLRKPRDKRFTFEDLKMVKRKLDG
jgi:DNA polymerase